MYVKISVYDDIDSINIKYNGDANISLTKLCKYNKI